MKLFVLALFSLVVVLSVSADEEIAAEAPLDQKPAESIYETFFNDYYPPPIQKTSNKKSSKNKNNKNQSSGQSSNQGSNQVLTEVHYGHGKEKEIEHVLKSEYDEYNNYLKFYEGHKEDFDEKLMGRKGLGFDKRTATPYGLKSPLTPEKLQVIYKYDQKDHGKEVIPIVL